MRCPLQLVLIICLTPNFYSLPAAQLPGNTATNAFSARPVWDVKAGPLTPKTPVDFFRNLLAMTEAERIQALAAKPEPQRVQIQNKLREYTGMTPVERESRLRAAQLHWYFEPLVMMAPGNRVAHLTAIPEADRRIIEQRLTQWDTLPDEMKKNVLEKQSAQRSVLPPGTNALPMVALFPTPKPDQTSRHDQDVRAWNQQSSQQRQKMVGQFGKFFEQPPPEKEKTLMVLPEAERVQMEKTLHAFEKLPPVQRQRCIDAFGKFDSLPSEERGQFLKTAERWRLMTAEERATWRKLVLQMPPLPPESLPPLPPPPKPRASQSVVSSSSQLP